MQNIFKEIVRLQSAGETAALATVVQVKGSTPRTEGSRMLIRRDGSILGSIGGGCIEAAVWQASKKTITTLEPQLLDYDLTGRTETPEGLICGGTMRVFLDAIQPEDPAGIFNELERAIEAGKAVMLATVVAGSGGSKPGAKMLVHEEGSMFGSPDDKQLHAAVRRLGTELILEKTPKLICLAPEGDGLVFVEAVFPQPAVYLFGAGHIGYAVSKIAALTGFKVAVIDDRPLYASKERFPDAGEFYVEDPADAVAHLNLNPASYAVIACRGHLEDQRVLMEVLKTKAGYIGMLGSRKKTKTVIANLENEGVSNDDLKRIHAPIGIPIATETPEEIAVSIMAEIIDARRSGKKVNRNSVGG